jgi:hypothetical protein
MDKALLFSNSNEYRQSENGIAGNGRNIFTFLRFYLCWHRNKAG